MILMNHCSIIFFSVYTDNCLSVNTSLSIHDGYFNDVSFTPHDVFNILSLTKQWELIVSAISFQTLQLCLCTTYIYTTCFLNVFYTPHKWKVHCVTPIFKSGDHTMVSNYHPISLNLLCIIL